MFIARCKHTASAGVFNLRAVYLRVCTGARHDVFGHLITSAHISGHICKITTYKWNEKDLPKILRTFKVQNTTSYLKSLQTIAPFIKFTNDFVILVSPTVMWEIITLEINLIRYQANVSSGCCINGCSRLVPKYHKCERRLFAGLTIKE